MRCTSPVVVRLALALGLPLLSIPFAFARALAIAFVCALWLAAAVAATACAAAVVAAAALQRSLVALEEVCLFSEICPFLFRTLQLLLSFACASSSAFSFALNALNSSRPAWACLPSAMCLSLNFWDLPSQHDMVGTGWWGSG